MAPLLWHFLHSELVSYFSNWPHLTNHFLKSFVWKTKTVILNTRKWKTINIWVPFTFLWLSLFLDAFAKLRNRLLASPCLSCPSVRIEQFGSHLTDFHKILYLPISWKSVDNVQYSLTSDNNNNAYKNNIHFWSHLPEFLSEWETFQIKAVEKIETNILRLIAFLRKSCRLWDKVGKYCTAGQATDDNMAHAKRMLDK